MLQKFRAVESIEIPRYFFLPIMLPFVLNYNHAFCDGIASEQTFAIVVSA